MIDLSANRVQRTCYWSGVVSAKVYISGALTNTMNPTEALAFYEAIGSLCKELGMQPYIPHLCTDPRTDASITPKEVYEWDAQEITTSELLIAYVGIPSLGIGMELARATMSGIPIILLYERKTRISRLARGIPTIIAEIQFNDHEDALAQLKDVLYQWQRSGDGV